MNGCMVARIAFLLILLGCFAAGQHAAAQTYWQGTTGDWFDPANWDNGVPTTELRAYINNGGTAQISGGRAEPYRIYLGYDVGISGTLELSDGELNAYREYVGRRGTGWFTQTGGSNTIKRELWLGFYSSSEGVYELSGDGRLSAGEEYLGYHGKARFTQTGGTNTTDKLYLAAWGTPFEATYELGGDGHLNVGEELIGGAGRAQFVQTGGLHTVERNLYVGMYFDSEGTYKLSGDGVLKAQGDVLLGILGMGLFTQTGGASEISGVLYVGAGRGSSGTYELQGEAKLSVDEAYIGATHPFYHGPSTGHFTQTGGKHSIRGALVLGQGAGSEGRYELGDEGKLLAAVEFIGDQGTGTFIQTGGKNTTGYLSINSLSRYELSGGKLDITGGGLNVEGVLDLSGSDARIKVGDDAIVNLFGGGVLGTAQSRLTVGANSLTIYAPGAHPADTFGSFATKGMMHQAGQVLDIQAGQGFAGRGRIDDHVVCAGTITASVGGGIDLNGGLAVVSPGAVVDLGDGKLTVDDLASGIAAGSLMAGAEYIGDTGTGSFSHTAGTNTIKRDLYLGYEPGSHGTYSISGGSLEARRVYVGLGGGSGELNILNSDASITVAEGLLRFGTHSVLTTVEGSTINIDRAKFQNRSTDPAALAGMSNLKVVFQRHDRDSKNTFEVAGQDMGASLAGLDLNFALHTLQVGSGGVRGVLQLVDNFDNQPGWVGDEALYVENLIIQGRRSLINLNGLNLYYLNGGELKQLFHGDANLDGRVDVTDLTALAANWSNPTGTWAEGDTNGDMLIDIVDLTALAANWGAETIVIPGGPVPEPGCLALMAAGGLVLLQRRRKRQSP